MLDQFSSTAATRSSAIADFRSARQKAKMLELFALIQRKPINLLGFEEVRQQLKANVSSYSTLKEIPVDAIVGSVNRYEDFTRDFLPRDNIDEERWTNIVVAAQNPAGLPPIEVYQIGDVYFVSDGNHRVSVAKQYGAASIQAYVTEVRSRVPLTPEISPDVIILKAEYVNFLENTNLDHIRPSADLSVTAPGQYLTLKEHIAVHRYFMGIDYKRDIAYPEAVGHWYDNVYLPLVEVIRELGLLRDFPDRTETDLYLWLHKYHAELLNKFGQDVEPARAAFNLPEEFGTRIDQVARRAKTKLLDFILPDSLEDGPPPGAWRAEKTIARRVDRLFSDVLVPVNGRQDGWYALEQAIQVVRHEDARLHGLYITNKKRAKFDNQTEKIQAEFGRRCNDAGVAGKLVISTGEVARRIAEYAAWNDLIVVNVTYPPAPKPFARLNSGFRTLLQRSPVPILAVPRTVSPLNRIMLAFDNSPKSREALFLAAYLSCQWKADLIVFSAGENDHTSNDIQSIARQYLEPKQIKAEYIAKTGEGGELIVDAAKTLGIDLILMGGYGLKPILQFVLGSTVDKVLRDSHTPMLICR